ncbi:CHAT domain-containing protein [Pseudactinotalea terrae]|uniref:CHAT domain-containing protein n=1 Tax=Pseudactinotalea terrae TaxID=1743262 RepID=UPI0012E3274C|nr:CHAT domain-containing protein [Pseudactinotalea terrae]
MVAEPVPVAELIERARAANSVGRPSAAEQLLRRAIRALSRPGAELEDQLLRGSATITLASPVFERHGLEPALALLDEADSLVPGHDGDGVRALGLVQRAGLLARCGQWRVAVELLSRIDPENGWLTARQLASVHLNRATARQYLGEHDRCVTDLQTALHLADTAHAPDLVFKARHNLGYTHFLVGDVPGALRAMGEADRMDVRVARATAKRDYARVLLHSGLTDEASELLHDAVTIATEHRLPHEVGEALVDTARLELLRGRPERASAAASQAARLFRRRGADGWWVQAEILRAEAVLAAGARPRAAATLARRLEQLPAQSRAVRRDALLAATHARLAAGDTAGAGALLSHVRGHAVAPSGRLQLDWLAAQLALAAGRPDQARRRLREAARRVAEQQARPASIDTRTAFALHAQRLVTLDVGTAVKTGSPAQVLAATERWRAATSRLPSLVPHQDSTLDELFTQLRVIRSQLAGSADDGGTDPLTRRAHDLEVAIRQREWELADDDQGARPLSPVRASAVSALAAATDTDVLALFAAGGRLGAVTIDARGMQLHDLGDAEHVAEQNRLLLADVAMAGRRLPGALATVVRRSLSSRVDAVARLLPVPMTRSRLLVVSTKVLRSLPWRLLPNLAERPVVVASSLTGWVTGEQPPATTGHVAALAGPHLTRADDEAKKVADAWAGRGVAMLTATGSDLAEALATSDVVHIAAHGHHHEQNALFSSVTMHDGPLFAYELQRRGVRAAHVVLSACDTGRAMIRPGDESIGLTATLLACGARSVVAAVAPVDDDVAAQLMTAYHRHLAAGISSSAALHRATGEIDHAGAAHLFCTYGSDWVLADPTSSMPGR